MFEGGSDEEEMKESEKKQAKPNSDPEEPSDGMTKDLEQKVKTLTALFGQQFCIKHDWNLYLEIPNINLIIHRFEPKKLKEFLKTEEDRKQMEVLLSNQSIRQLFLTCHPNIPDYVFNYLTTTAPKHDGSMDNYTCFYCNTKGTKVDDYLD